MILVAEGYENREFRKVGQECMALADRANQYVAEKEPWTLTKREGKEHEVQDVCSVALSLFRLLVIYLKPILPAMGEKAEIFLNTAPLSWADLDTLMLDHRINIFKPPMFRVETERITAMIRAAEEDASGL